jgi:hypothetical protein
MLTSLVTDRGFASVMPEGVLVALWPNRDVTSTSTDG